MNVTCPSCSTVYRVDPAKVPGDGVRARCRVCTAIFPIRREAALPPDKSAPSAPEPAPPPPPPPPLPVTAPAPAAETAPPPPVPEAAAPVSVPQSGSPAGPEPAPPPSSAPERDELRTTEPWSLQQTARHTAAPPVVMPPASPVRPATSRGGTPAGPAVAPRPAAAGAGSSRRLVNPFLAQNPEAKARRLARALISDLVAYNPERRQQALQNGKLREVFEEEIRKSWEEYAEQVGHETAESTPFFTEALNEILAGGKKVF